MYRFSVLVGDALESTTETMQIEKAQQLKKYLSISPMVRHNLKPL